MIVFVVVLLFVMIYIVVRVELVVQDYLCMCGRQVCMGVRVVDRVLVFEVVLQFVNEYELEVYEQCFDEQYGLVVLFVDVDDGGDF